MTNANAPVVEKWERQRIRHVHRHKPVININKIDAEKQTTGQRVADGLAAVMGSWAFIIIQAIILMFWITLNVIAYINHWDPYPFILLNLALSFQAAYAAPIIMMSQNRQAPKDRLMGEQDYAGTCNAAPRSRRVRYQPGRLVESVKRFRRSGDCRRCSARSGNDAADLAHGLPGSRRTRSRAALSRRAPPSAARHQHPA